MNKPVNSIKREFNINNNNKTALDRGSQRRGNTCSLTLLADASYPSKLIHKPLL